MPSPVPMKNRAWLLTPASKQRNSSSPSYRIQAQGFSESAQIGRHRFTVDSPSPGAGVPDEQGNASMELHRRNSGGRSPKALPSTSEKGGHEDRGLDSTREGQITEDTQHRDGGSKSSNKAESSSAFSQIAPHRHQNRSPSPQLGSSRQQTAESPISGLQVSKSMQRVNLPASLELSKRQWQFKVTAVPRADTSEKKEALMKDISQKNPVWMVPKIIHRSAKPISSLGLSLLSPFVITHLDYLMQQILGRRSANPLKVQTSYLYSLKIVHSTFSTFDIPGILF